MKNKLKTLLLLAFFGLSLLIFNNASGQMVGVSKQLPKYDTLVCDTPHLLQVFNLKVTNYNWLSADSVYITELTICDDSPGNHPFVDSIFMYEDGKLLNVKILDDNTGNCIALVPKQWIMPGKSKNIQIYVRFPSGGSGRKLRMFLASLRYKEGSLSAYTQSVYPKMLSPNFYLRHCYPLVSVKPSYTKNNNQKSFCLGDSVKIYNTIVGKKYVIKEEYFLNGKAISKSFLLSIKLKGAFTKVVVSVTDSFSRIFKDSIVFSAKPNPSGKITSLNGFAYCKGDSLELRYSNSAIDSIRWMFPDGIDRVRDLGTATIGPGLYKVMVDSAGCASSDSVFITENSLPQLNIVGKSGFCKGDSVILVCNTKKGETVSWSNGSELGSNDSFVAKGSGLYRVRVTDSNKCFRDSVITIVDYKIPSAEIAVAKETFCEGDTNYVSLKDQSVDGWYWIINKKKVETKSVAVYLKTSIELYTTSVDGCKNSSIIELAPKGLPPAEIIVSKEVFCEGDNNYVSLKTDKVASWYWIVNRKKIEGKTVIITTSASVKLHTTSIDGCKNSSVIELIPKSLPDKPLIMNNDSMLWSLNNKKGDSLVWCNMYTPIPGANGRFFKPLFSGYYTLRVYSEYGCMNESDLLIYSPKQKTTSIGNIVGKQFNVYPNPVIDQFTIESSLEKGQAELIDMQGRVVRTFTVEYGSNTIYREGLASGMYYVRYQGDAVKLFFSN